MKKRLIEDLSSETEEESSSSVISYKRDTDWRLFTDEVDCTKKLLQSANIVSNKYLTNKR